MEETDHSHAQVDLPTEKSPGVYRIGGYVGPGVGLDVVEKKKIPLPMMGLDFQPIA